MRGIVGRKWKKIWIDELKDIFDLESCLERGDEMFCRPGLVLQLYGGLEFHSKDSG